MKLREKHLYKTEIQKVNNNSQRKYSRMHLEKEQMPTKEEENNIFLTNVGENFEKQIRDVPIFGCEKCKKRCFIKYVVVMKQTQISNNPKNDHYLCKICKKN